MPKVTAKTKTSKKTARRNGHTNGTVKTTKVDTKTVAKPEKKAKTVEYTPQSGSMRYFIFQALHGSLASTNVLKKRAARLADKAGVKKYADAEAYKAFDIVFFVKHLEDKGVKIEHDGEKYAIV